MAWQQGINKKIINLYVKKIIWAIGCVSTIAVMINAMYMINDKYDMVS
jgi:hypothetical protein